ncbi:MAG: cation-transporting P-type ATPase [Deltaproteobacteria bacterium]|nr:cation-transporting P-type ATPase [Deltaproteobacteria bacterium]
MPHSNLGLTSHEARKRLEVQGPNEVIPSDFESTFSQLKHALFDPMGLMLLGLSFLYLLIGDRTDAIVLFIAFIPVTAVDVVLELKASKALRALKATLNPKAKVLRDSQITEVPSRELVVGDVLVFEEGQTLPADGKVLEVATLTLSEAALTGESIPLDKSEGHFFYAGTTVLSGRGLGLVEVTGRKTQYGKIARLLEKTEAEVSPLRKKVDRLVKKVLSLALLLAVILFAVELFRHRPFVESLIVALTFGMAAVPEEFPLVFTLYLSLGAWRLSKHGVLVKSLPSVETLGSVDVICTDKTGTLTEGRFQLEELQTLESSASDELWTSALMACEIHVVDSMELAIVAKSSVTAQKNIKNWKLIHDYPFELSGKHMSHVWHNADTGEWRMAMKGAMEGVLEHCDLSPEESQKIEKMTTPLAQSGKRLLGLATRGGSFNGDRIQDENKLKFIGVLVFNDPVRPSIKAAVLKCQEAGIQVKMLTGDHPLTAHAVADEVGMLHSHVHLYTGDQLSKMSESERFAAYEKGAIFSRVLPEQKHEMVQALKASGKIVAMTGDGINDAPALKLADIGISMGQNATDVARSSAQMVLLKNDFSGISEAVFEGRRIFSNLKRSFSYLVAFHIPIILLALCPPLLGWGDLLLPLHIVLLELIVHPVSAFTFENMSPDQAARNEKQGLLSSAQIGRSALAGMLVSLGALLLFYFLTKTQGIELARTAAFTSVLLGNIFFVLNESWPLLTRRFYITMVSIAFLSLAFVFVPTLATMFHFKMLGFRELFLSLLVASLALLTPLGGRNQHHTLPS